MEIRLEELRRVQREVSSKVVLRDGFRTPIRRISGVDLAFTDDWAIAACVAVSFPPLKIVDKVSLARRLDFPYIPGFLSFREGPAMVEVIKNLNTESDIFIINAHGVAHPTFCGCASHVGVLANRPTIGVAARRLCGKYEHEPMDVGEWVQLRHGGRVVGAVLKSKERCNPIFVSPGHLISLESSIMVVKASIRGHKMPEPLYHAHRLANEDKRRIFSS
ncbi:MAG: endonuclease V [Candidatus Bathyarchaeia archaeon]